MDVRLVKAARVGDVNTLHNLMGADPEILERASSTPFADSPLHVAALYGKADFVEQIVTLMPSLATETNQQGKIPLHLASLKGHVETVKELLKAKLDDGVNQCLVKDEEGWTPLHCASQKGKIMVMEELVNACPECLEQVTAKGETVLHLAVKANQFEAVKVLAERIKRLPNFQTLLKAQDQKGKNAYQLAEAKNQLQVLEVLKEDDEKGGEIRKGCCINVVGEGSDGQAGTEEKSKESKEWQSQQDAILVVATLIITLTYQALANPPSTFLKDGNTKIDWGCLRLDVNHRSQGLIKYLKECPAGLALVFLISNTSIFTQSILVVLIALRGRSVQIVRMITVFLAYCYSILLMAFWFNTAYFAIPYAFLMMLFSIYIDPSTSSVIQRYDKIFRFIRSILGIWRIALKWLKSMTDWWSGSAT